MAVKFMTKYMTKTSMTAAAVAVAVALTGCGGSTTTDSATGNAEVSDASANDTASETTGESNVEETTTTTVATTTTTTTTTTTEAPTTTTTTTVAEPAYDFVDNVVLIDAGAEPRQELRLMLATGTETMNMRQTQSMTQAIDGQTTVDGSTTVVDSATNLKVSPKGDNFVVDSVLTSMTAGPGTDPAIASILESELQTGVGLETTSIINPRGLIGSSSVDSLGDAVLDQVVGEVANAANPFPEEAVGVGAVWESTNTLMVLGLEVEQIQRVTVVSIEGTVVTLEVEATQNVPPGTTGSVDGQRITVNSWSSVGSGSVVLDLTQTVPVRSTLSTTAEQDLEISGFGLTQSISIDLEMTAG